MLVGIIVHFVHIFGKEQEGSGVKADFARYIQEFSDEKVKKFSVVMMMMVWWWWCGDGDVCTSIKKDKKERNENAYKL